jgi:hypothetical protein
MVGWEGGGWVGEEVARSAPPRRQSRQIAAAWAAERLASAAWPVRAYLVPAWRMAWLAMV